MKRSLFLFLLFINITFAYSQEKLEREYRIKDSEVPEKALDYVESSFQNVRMKWYGEENLKGKAIEAKGRMHGKLYSVKFNIKGDLEDIEQVLDFNSIPDDVRNAIEKNLGSRFTKFKLQKTQLQWLGSPGDLAALVKGEKVNGVYSTNYEITFMGTRDGRTEFYEILADHKGAIARESRIVQRTNQNLIY
jgi:predicted RNA binding protein with dsRBD fold (UPF0201 family)